MVRLPDREENFEDMFIWQNTRTWQRQTDGHSTTA